MTKKKETLYFRSEDDNTCRTLSHFISEAKFEGLSEITLIEAEPDNNNPDYIFCMDSGEVGERQECKKSLCKSYSSKSGRGVCGNRGHLYTYGCGVTFKI